MVSKNEIELKEVNLLDRIAIENLIHDNRPNEFYNLAAQSSVGLSFKEPAITFKFNALSVIKILEAIREGLLKIILDDKYRNNLIEKGRENAKRFSADTLAQQYVEIYREMANHKNFTMNQCRLECTNFKDLDT